MRFFFLLAALLLAAPAAQAADGDCGTIVLPTGAGQTEADDLTSFNPLFVDDQYNEESAWLMFPNLIWVNRFSQIDWSRSLASSITTTDNTNFIVTMRPWHWSDGVPVTAGDAVYYFKLGQKLGPSWVAYGSGGLPYIVKSIKVLSPTQFQVTTIHPVNPTWFIYNGIGGIQPLPEHAWGKYTLDQLFQLQSTPSMFRVVDGPVMLQKLDVGLDAVFVPNPKWDGPKMHFDRLIFKFLQGDGAAVQGVLSGDTDDGSLPTDLYAAYQHLTNAHIEVLQQGAVENVINLNLRNPKDPFFHDVRVRQAMIDAINQEAIIHGLEHNDGDPSYGPITLSMAAFLTPAMRAGTYPVGYNPAKARALLAQAGYTPGPDGIMQKNGQRLSFTNLEEAGTNAVTELDEIEQADLRAVGIEMKLRIMNFNQMIALMAGSPLSWDTTGMGYPVQAYPSGEVSFETGSFQNMGGYSDPTMDKLINENLNDPSMQHLFDYETYVSEQQPMIFGPRQRAVILVNNRLHGIANFINPTGMYAPDQLWCSAPAGATP